MVIGFQPDAYYLSSSKPFTIGSTNQDSASMKIYKSGTDFYNLFHEIPVGTNSAVTGAISVDNVAYVVSRIRKDEDKIVFYTDRGEKAVHKFVSGTSTGAYADLRITTSIAVGKVDGGIETMTVSPWSHAAFDIGQTDKRFRSMYLSNELVAGSIAASTGMTGNVNSSGTPYKVYGAVFN
jgi:hypothetical protein